jgi:methyltransferase (TIGR00027 family)
MDEEGQAMMSPVGLTSRWVAASRACESEHPDALFHDSLARPLAGEEGFEFLSMADSFRPKSSQQEPNPVLSIRTRFFDDALLHVVAERSFSQVVFLAAGMDARAYRLEWPDGVSLFEVDRQEVLDHKEAVLQALGVTPRCDRRVVAADLTGDWQQRLQAAGFDPARPSAFLVEGLLVYLEEAAVNRLLGDLSRLAPRGSWIGMDLADVTLLRTPFMAPLMEELVRRGSPWIFGTSEPEALLERFGWSATALTLGEPGANYGRWPYPIAPRHTAGVPRSYLVTGDRSGGTTAAASPVRGGR